MQPALPTAPPQRELILASSSRYRRELLLRLRLPFECLAPQVDETPHDGESPRALALRLALDKARVISRQYPAALVIGSDQVADLNGQALGKPGNFERAAAQLRAMSGQTIIFHTALAVVCQETGFEQADISAVRATFRPLDPVEIQTYLKLEEPYDCAGSAKSEGLGIALLERIDSDDPTALIGLPLIRVARMLREAGHSVILASAP